jgi:hypothetical protein
MFEGLNRAVAVSHVHPVIDKFLPFEQARDVRSFRKQRALRHGLYGD